jgi:WD40 repeat protein
LHQEILPEIQEIARQENIQAMLYDMRFGVKDENTKDHMTWIICRDAIDQCFEESDGLAFLSLQADKYGYRPIPKFVDRIDLEEALSKADTVNSSFCKNWFELDENSIPARYELRSLQSLNDNNFYETVMPAIRENVLTSTVFDKDADLVVGRSVTEWETLYAFWLDKLQKKCFWVQRKFDLDSYRKFSDKSGDYWALTDSSDEKSKSIKLKLENLKSKMNSQLLPKNSMVEVDLAISADDYLTANANSSSTGSSSTAFDKNIITEDISRYLKRWKLIVSCLLQNEISNMILQNRRFKEIINDHNGLSEEYMNEIVHHLVVWKNKCASFIGRETLITTALAAFTESNDYGTNDALGRKLLVSLALVGKSGTGKTSLMSLIAKKISSNVANSHDIPVIVRFCGTSPNSLHAYDLIVSICVQILMIFEDKVSLLTFKLKQSSMLYEDLVVYFHQLLAQHPVYLFIDSLDQLSNRNEARSKLNFLLASNPIHALSKVVVSTLPDEKDNIGDTYKYIYLCEQRIKEFKARTLKIGTWEDSNEEEVRELISQLLVSTYSMKFTETQWNKIWTAVVPEASILYLKLAVEVVRKWRSFDEDCLISPTVKGILNQLFDELEKQYGYFFTARSFALISFSRSGMRDLEMRDCLSMDEDVLKEVFQYSKLQSFPMHVWLRLKYLIKGLLTEKENSCLQWYHRQIWETAKERYNRLKVSSHSILGRYFSNLISPEVNCHRGLQSQPLSLNGKVIWSSACKYNSRRIKEGYYNLIKSHQNDEVIDELCRLEFIHASAMVGDIFDLLNYLGKFHAKVISKAPLPIDKDKLERLEHYLGWLRPGIYTISKNTKFETIATALAEPRLSLVRSDAEKLIVDIERNVCKKGKFDTEDIVFVRTLTGQVREGVGNLIMNIPHSRDVSSVIWSRDGTKLVSGCEDNNIRIWDSATGSIILTLEGHSDKVGPVAWNSVYNTLASGSNDTTIKIWYSATGNLIHTLEGHSDAVYSLAWSPDGSKLASGSKDNTINIWDIHFDKVNIIKTFEGHSGIVQSVAWNHDGTKLVSGSKDKNILIWDMILGNVIFNIQGDSLVNPERHSGEITCVAWSCDGQRIASGSVDKTIKIWDSQTGKLLSSLNGDSRGILSLAWHPDGRKISSGDVNGKIRVWDTKTDNEIVVFAGHSLGVTSVPWSPDGNKIVSSSWDKTVKIWNMLKEPETESDDDNQRVISVDVAWNPDGSKLASASGDNTVKIWDPITANLHMVFDGHYLTVCAVAWSPDGKVIASGSADRTLIIWESSTGNRSATLEGHSNTVTTLAWSPDGEQIASGSADTTILIWDSKTWNIQMTLIGHLESVSCVKWSPDGNTIFSGSKDKSCKLWNSKTGYLISSIEGHSLPVVSVAWNHDGTKIISGSYDKTVKIWDAISKQLLMTLEDSNLVKGVAWNPDGTKIVTVNHDSSIKIWDTITFKSINILESHTEYIPSVAWNPDGSKIASCSWDCSIKIWTAYSLLG